MGPAARPPDLRRPPSGLDARIDWFDQIGAELVRLATYPLPDLERALSTFDGTVRAHLSDPGSGAPSVERPRPGGGSHLLESEHERFVTSLEQLWWFYSIVERDDHGGHRQALGQYMRIFAEALRRHRDDESSPDSRREARAHRGPRRAASGNAN
jgi:hypothetical protein